MGGKAPGREARLDRVASLLLGKEGEAVRVLFLLIVALATSGCRGSHSEAVSLDVAREVGLFLALALAEYFNTPNDLGRIPCDDALSILDAADHPVLATVLGLYDAEANKDDWTCVQRFVERSAERAHTVQIYLFYDVSAHPTLEQLISRAMIAQARMSAISGPLTEVRYVLTLEDRLGAKFETYAQSVEEVLGERVARNPLDHSQDANGREKEVHGRGALCSESVQIGNQDGFYFTPEETLAWAEQNASCSTLLIVQPEWQDLCLVNGEPRKCVPLSERQPHFYNIGIWQDVVGGLSGR